MKNSSQLNQAHYVKPLTEWVKQTIENRLWEKYDDLHLDVLDARFRKPGRWVEVSLVLLSCLRDIVDGSKYKVLVSIPLHSVGGSMQVNTLSIDMLEESVADTPPSFYLFPVEDQVFAETLKTALYSPSLSQLLHHEVYFKEQEIDEEYYRWLFVQ
jgi:hypothetical protein